MRCALFQAFPRSLMVVAGLALALLAAGGVAIYQAQERVLARQAEAELTAIARLEIDGISDWRDGQLASAAELTASAFLAEAAARWFEAPTIELTAELENRFHALQLHHELTNVCLLDREGRVRLDLAGGGKTLAPEDEQAVAQAYRQGGPVFIDFHTMRSRAAPHTGVVTPLIRGSSAGGQAIGAVLLEQNAERFLYPRIRSWPVPSQTAETLLVRRDGDSVLFLNDLRHRPSTAMSLRIPLTRLDVPAVQAVLGRRGLLRGTDYRGVPVLAVLAAIPASPWFMVAKIDQAEVFAARRLTLGLMLAAALALVAAMAAAFGLLWQRKDTRHFRLLAAAEANARAVAERNRQLEAQLQQSQKMEAIGRLAGGVAHDFNNILQAILGYTDIALSAREAAGALRTDLEAIQTAGRRAAGLTRQLMAFARRQPIEPQVVDLNETVAATIDMLGRIIGEDTELAWQPGADLGPVYIDASQIEQVLTNLVVNARDAITGVGKVTIETSRAVFDDSQSAERPDCAPGDYMQLSVSDDGCGMDKTTQSMLFEPFFTTKKMGKGTGLGLATVFGIVKQNGGFIHVYSEPGIGSTFKVYLPRAPAQTEAEATARRAHKPTQLAAPRGTEPLLLVEDEPAILAVGKAMLERLGYTVCAAATPGEALRLARDPATKIALVVTDVIMPEMNGRELFAELARIRPGLRCLYVSSYTAHVIARQGIVEEGVHLLQKPFTTETLARKVREVLDQA